jgi:hypothetical protein
MFFCLLILTLFFSKAKFKDDIGNNRQNAANIETARKIEMARDMILVYRQLVSKAHKNMNICRKIIERTDK